MRKRQFSKEGKGVTVRTALPTGGPRGTDYTSMTPKVGFKRTLRSFPTLTGGVLPGQYWSETYFTQKTAVIQPNVTFIRLTCNDTLTITAPNYQTILVDRVHQLIGDLQTKIISTGRFVNALALPTTADWDNFWNGLLPCIFTVRAMEGLLAASEFGQTVSIIANAIARHRPQLYGLHQRLERLPMPRGILTLIDRCAGPFVAGDNGDLLIAPMPVGSVFSGTHVVDLTSEAEINTLLDNREADLDAALNLGTSSQIINLLGNAYGASEPWSARSFCDDPALVDHWRTMAVSARQAVSGPPNHAAPCVDTGHGYDSAVAVLFPKGVAPDPLTSSALRPSLFVARVGTDATNTVGFVNCTGGDGQTTFTLYDPFGHAGSYGPTTTFDPPGTYTGVGPSEWAWWANLALNPNSGYASDIRAYDRHDIATEDPSQAATETIAGIDKLFLEDWIPPAPHWV